MIVRIAGEGRWRVPDGRSAELLREDLRLMCAVDDERRHGQPLPPGAHLADLTIPSPQMTLAETVELLAERSSL